MVTALDLEAPLDPDLQYFDATPSIEELAKMYATLQKAMKIQSVINQGLTDHIKALTARVGELEQQTGKKSSILLPPRMNS